MNILIVHRGRWAALLFFLATILLHSQICSAKDPFVVYPEIQPNVEFWKKIYSHYTTDQIVIHDSVDLNMIYGVIELERPESEIVKIINRKKVDSYRKRYRRLLVHLSRHPNTANPEARKIAALFGSNADRQQYKTASLRVRSQQGQKDRFREGVIRSGAYMEKIREIFTAYNIPVDLSYLPHVESSFDIHALSKSGALGLWQFTRYTGRRFLAIDSVMDQRLDFLNATHAAAKLLKENYEKLGHWPMALTAYNHGAAGMMRAKRKKGTYENIFTSYHSRSFGFASRNFYSEFIAAREIAQNHVHYFGHLDLDEPPQLHTLRLPGYVAAADLADHLGIPLDALRELNPSLTDAVYSGAKWIPRNHQVYLPVRPGLRLPGFTAALPADIFMNQQKPSTVYVVRKGDTAGKIAKKNGIKLSDLMLANNLDRHATIYINQQLKLPVRRSTNTRIAAHPTKTSKRTTAADPKPVIRSASLVQSDLPSPERKMILAAMDRLPDVKIHKTETISGVRLGKIQVLPDETLGHYARWLGAEVDAIRDLNDLNRRNTIQLNQEVRIPLNKTSVKTFERRRSAYHRKIREIFYSTYRVEDTVHYYVKPGDNVWRLSNEVFGVPLWLLGKYNPHVDFTALKKSQKLLVPKVERII